MGPAPGPRKRLNDGADMTRTGPIPGETIPL